MRQIRAAAVDITGGDPCEPLRGRLAALRRSRYSALTATSIESGPARQRGPFALAEHLRHAAHRSPEQAAPLRDIERHDDRRQHGRRDRRGDAEVARRAVHPRRSPAPVTAPVTVCAQNGKTPDTANRICATACSVALTVMAAAASRMRIPRCEKLAHHHDRTADLAGRQQAVHRFADPAREQRFAMVDRIAPAEHADGRRGHLLKPRDKRRQTVKLRDERRETVDRVPSHAAARLVAWQAVTGPLREAARAASISCCIASGGRNSDRYRNDPGFTYPLRRRALSNGRSAAATACSGSDAPNGGARSSEKP